MPIKDKDYLKSRFQTGDNPEQSDFEDLIDSFMHVNEFVAEELTYDPIAWDNNTDAPTMNSVRDKFELVDQAINGKANTVHTHVASDITDFNTAADARITAQKGANNGVATLDGSGKIPSAQLPPLAISNTYVVNSQAAQLALTTQEGDIAVRTDLNKSYIKNSGTSGTMSDWQELLTPTDSVLSVNGQTGSVNLTTSDVSEGANLYFTQQRVLATISSGTGVDISSGVISLNANAKKKSFGLTIDGGGSPITPGVKGDIIIPSDMTITGWTLIGDQVGSIVIDVWKDTYANYPATMSDSIAGTEKPTLSSVIKNQNTSLTTWSATVAAGDIIRFNVDSASTLTRVSLLIHTILV